MGFFSGCKNLGSVEQPKKSSSSEVQPKQIHEFKITMQNCPACEGCFEKVENKLMKIKGTRKVVLMKKEDYDLFIRVITSVDPETIIVTLMDNKKVKVKSAELMNTGAKDSVREPPPVNSAAAPSKRLSTKVAAPGTTIPQSECAGQSSSTTAVADGDAPSHGVDKPAAVMGSTGTTSSDNREKLPARRIPTRVVSVPTTRMREGRPSTSQQGGSENLAEPSGAGNDGDKAPSRMVQREKSQRVELDVNKPSTN